MRKQVTHGLVALLMLLGLAFCGKKEVSQKPTSMVIVFTSGEATVVKGAERIPARVGLLVAQNDEIQTTNGSVDLQTRGGSAIRVKEFTTIKVATLLGDGDTKISMKHGGLLANVKKSSANEDFSVVTPTAIAGVRGTTFSVEMEDEQSSPVVKVLDGKVAMSPRITALEKADAATIQKDESLSRLAEIQRKNEVIVEPATSATLDRAVEIKIMALNAAVEQAEQQNRAIDEVVKADNIKQMSTDLAASEKVVIKQESPVTAAEKADKATLVAVDGDLVEKVIAGEGQATAVEALREQRKEREEAIVADIQKEAAKTELKSQEAIRQHYNKLETVIMTNGTQHHGAVIAQTGGVLVVHTEQGVIRLDKGQVAAIEFR